MDAQPLAIDANHDENALPTEDRTSETKMSWMQRISRGVEILLGTIFLLGAVLKATDINLFAVQIKFYGVLASSQLINTAAIGVLWIETALGLALVLGFPFRKWILAAVLMLLMVFSGLIGYGWFFHGLKDCGCFGPIEMSPGISLFKNVLLALMTVAVGMGTTRGFPSMPQRIGIRCVIIGVMAIGVSGYAMAHLESAPDQERPFAQFVFEEDGLPWDLGKGEYLVAMLSMTCEHCMASVPKLNEMTQTEGLPSLVALCYEEKTGELESFRTETDPLFPLHSLGNRVRIFFGLIGNEPPRLIYVKEGKQIQFWDVPFPSPEELRSQLPAPVSQ